MLYISVTGFPVFGFILCIGISATFYTMLVSKKYFAFNCITTFRTMGANQPVLIRQPIRLSNVNCNFKFKVLPC